MAEPPTRQQIANLDTVRAGAASAISATTPAGAPSILLVAGFSWRAVDPDRHPDLRMPEASGFKGSYPIASGFRISSYSVTDGYPIESKLISDSSPIPENYPLAIG